MTIDFGRVFCISQNLARITKNCGPGLRLWPALAAVVNVPLGQIGKHTSQVLPGYSDENSAVVLFSPDRAVPLGSRLF